MTNSFLYVSVKTKNILDHYYCGLPNITFKISESLFHRYIAAIDTNYYAHLKLLKYSDSVLTI